MKIVYFVSLLIGFGLCANERHIKNADELIQFANDVNDGTNHLGTTIFLDNDIEFFDNQSEKFFSIGKNVQRSFQGIFDGQGNVIKNLIMNYTSLFSVGLFGYSQNITVKNTILDSSCSVYGTYPSYSVNVGGLIGECETRTGKCTVENCVNMASVTSYTEYAINTAGIIGYCTPAGSSAICTVKNCANYGTITSRGVPTSARIGGILGHCFTLYGSFCTVQNSLNYGNVAYEGIAVSVAKIGGIVGSNYNSGLYVENCISGGGIVSAHTSSVSIGSVVGYLAGADGNGITHCVWTDDVNSYSIVGEEGFSLNVTIENTEYAELNNITVKKMNEYAKINGFDKWFLVNLNGGKINELDQDILVASQRYFPEPVKENKKFKGWYTDAKFGKKYDPKNSTATVENVFAKYGKVKKEMTSSKIAIIVLACVCVVAVIVIVVLAVALCVVSKKLGDARNENNSERRKILINDSIDESP